MKVFKEEQRFTQTWLHILLTLGAIIPTFFIIKQWINANDRSLSANWSSIISLLAIILVHYLVYNSKLTTRIDKFGIYYQFYPFHFSTKRIHWHEIDNIYVRKYDAISEYGGWGLRYTFSKRGRAINVSGNTGIQIELKNGKKILIGTQKEDEATEIIKKAQKND